MVANRPSHIAAADGGRVPSANVQAAPRVAVYNKPKSRLLAQAPQDVGLAKADETYHR